MENRVYYLSWLCIVPGLTFIGLIPLNDAITNAGWGLLLNAWVKLPIFLLVALSVLKQINQLAHYTDEFMPTKLCAVSILLTIAGNWATPQMVILGLVGIILSAYWSRRTVRQYYPTTEN